MSEPPRIQSFDQFWPYYVRAHRKPLNRALHFLGTTSALACTLIGTLTLNPVLLGLVPVVGYGPSWIGHFLVEGNRPATFGYAAYSLLADFKMVGLMLQGKMADEVALHCGARRSDPVVVSAPAE